MKNIFIIGDSYSTYDGYIPEGYHTYYGDKSERIPYVNGVEKTWWRIFEKENGINIVFNDSFSGSTICNTVRKELSTDSSFVSRIDKYISENFFAENKVDTIIIFGGTNDSWIDSPIGNLQYSNWSDEDLKYVLPAFCYLVARAKTVAENVIVVINSELKQEITQGFVTACKNSEIPFVELCEIDKENGHPTELGMKQISAQVSKFAN